MSDAESQTSFGRTFFEPIPLRSEVLGQSTSENAALADRLDIGLPGELENAPPTLSFDRLREIDLPWRKLIEDMGRNQDAKATSVSPLRSYFERSWWGDDRDEPAPALLSELVQDGLLLVIPGSPEAPVLVEYAGAGNVGSPIEAGVVLRNGVSGRYYLIETRDDETPELSTTEGYTRFWEEQVEGAALVFLADDDLETSQTAYEDLNLRAIHIERRYRELREMERVVRLVSQKAGATLEEIIEEGRTADLSFEGLEAVQSRYISIRLNPYRIQRNLRQLKRQAAQMGYLLFLGDEPGMAKVDGSDANGELPAYQMKTTFPDGKETSVVAGELYTTFKRKCTYTVAHKKSVVRNFGENVAYGFKRFFGGRAEKPKKTYQIPKAKIVKDYKKVDTLTDPLTAKVMAFQDLGREVYVFNETPAGYVSDSGIALATIMTRCDLDEDFRRNCVVMIPVYEPGFAVEKPIVSYNIFERPLPGIMPTRLPRLFVDESLTYRMAWKGTELGELASTINLAPGETREINITRSFQEERTTSETKTSVSELNSSESTDIATEMENIARTENEFSTHVDYSNEAKAGASIEGLGSASSSSKFSAGASDTLKTFNQGMNKVAKKAATSISRKNSLNVTTASTSKTTVSTSDNLLIKMSNINQGRTLNLMFYRVFNRFSSGLFIENIRFAVTSGVELIAGSGIHETVTFRHNRISDMLDMFRRTPLPFNNSTSAIAHYQSTILDTVLEQLRLEYLVEDDLVEAPEENSKTADVKSLEDEPSKSKSSGNSSNAVLISPELMALFEPTKSVETGDKKASSLPTPSRELLDKHIASVEAGLSKIEVKATPLQGSGSASSDLLIASTGLYMDAIVGARPSTEPYSEEMRAQEVRKSAAEVLKSEAEAQYTLAQARRIEGMPKGANPTNNVLTGVHVLDDGRARLLSLGFMLPLQGGNWIVCVDEKPMPGFEIPEDQLNRTSVVLKVPAAAKRSKSHWSNATDLMQRVVIREQDTFDEIGLG